MRILNVFHPASGTAGCERGKLIRKSPTSSAFWQITVVPFLFDHFQVGGHSGHAVETI